VSGVLDDVVPLATQPVDDPAIHAHVGEETHGRRSGQPDFFARQPSGVFDRLPDVLAFEVGGASENLLEGRAVGDQIPLRSPGSVRELVDAGAEAAVHAQQGGGVGKQLMDAAEAHAAREWKVPVMQMTVIDVRDELIGGSRHNL